MKSDDQLEKFRLQWKSELNSKKQTQSSTIGKNEHKFNEKNSNVTEADKKDVKRSYFHNAGEEQKKEPVSVTEQSNCIKSYYPFQIVENLLFTKEDGKKDELDGDLSQNHQSNSVSPKRKCAENKICSRYKKTKLLNLKDIFSNKQNKEFISQEKLLDQLIADIDEITEIPFFDTSLPREVAVNIFQHLDMVDLCRCAQVSKSWRSLAEDELLWCRLCHKLGHENIYTTREKQNWKQIVEHNVERQRMLITNWKNRTGKLSPLEHVKGKILCAVHSHGSTVVAGYTSGEVKLWELSGGDSCVFQPSSTSLVLDMNEDGLQDNIVTNVVTSDDVTVASYSQGNVDIWSLSHGTQPIQTFTPVTGNQGSSCISLSEDGTSLAVCYASYIDFLRETKQDDEFEMLHHYDSQQAVRHMKLYDHDGPAGSSVIFAHTFSVYIYKPVMQGTRYVDHVTELHNLIGVPVELIDFKIEQSVLGIGLGWYGTLSDGYRMKLYDIKTGKLLQTLLGHTWSITCMNMVDSPHNELVTGSGDRRLRIFDMRSCNPVQTLIGHGSRITCVQMDEWKVVSGADDGFLCVWDRRMAAKLWDLHNRHPVKYCHFNDKTLIGANISGNKYPEMDEFDGMMHRRYRGSLNVYNFLEDLTTKDIPEICLSTYDQPDASMYNIGLAMPYDTLQY